MNYIKDEERYFYHTSFALACFLFAKGMQMSEPRELENKQKEFVFVRTPRLEELVDAYKFGLENDEDLLVSARKYDQARREILDIIK